MIYMIIHVPVRAPTNFIFNLYHTSCPSTIEIDIESRVIEVSFCFDPVPPPLNMCILVSEGARRDPP